MRIVTNRELTPEITYTLGRADAGIMISASHNPVADNGIKFFGSDEFKLAAEMGQRIEQLLDMPTGALPRPVRTFTVNPAIN